MSGNWYTNRSLLKSALGIQASATEGHAQLDDALDSVARQLDDYLGFHAYAASGTRYYTARESDCLYLDAPIVSVDTVRITTGNASYETTLSTATWWNKPFNATEESPKQPWWELEIRSSATSVFPKGVQRGVQVIGTWGYFNQQDNSSATLATEITSGATTIQLNAATALAVGMTILMGTEQMFVTRTPASATGAHTSTVDVLRGQNGYAPTTHSCATAISVYSYPIVGRAALFQAEQDYRVKDAAMGFAGGEPYGVQRPTMPDLHWNTKRMLSPMRKPVVA